MGSKSMSMFESYDRCRDYYLKVATILVLLQWKGFLPGLVRNLLKIGSRCGQYL